MPGFVYDDYRKRIYRNSCSGNIIIMRNHGFDNTVLMCGMYEIESLALTAGV